MLPKNTRSYAKKKKRKKNWGREVKLTQSINKNSNCGGRQLIVAGACFAGQKSEKELSRNVQESRAARDGAGADGSGVLSQCGYPQDATEAAQPARTQESHR